MAPPTGAHVWRNAVVSIAATQYANQLRIARLVPDTPIQSYRTLVPDGAVQDVDSPLWTFEITGLQINRTGGLAHALRVAEVGSTLAIVLTPHDADGEDSATFNVLALPPPFGGTQGEFGTIEMVLPVLGQPAFSEVEEA
jgi:hypothetical protein